jgi:hypothetical protein
MLAINWKSYEKSAFIGFAYIKTIHLLFYNYVFNFSQKLQTFWYKSVISSVEVYDKQIITCHFSYHTQWFSGWYLDLGLI